MKRTRSIEYCKPWEHGRTWQGLRFVENPELGLRLVGFADQVARKLGYTRSIDHMGWYCDAFQDSTVRGVVFRLPHGRFIPGYVSSNDCTGQTRGRGVWNFNAAVLAFNDVCAEEFEAAKLADQLAESIAESEREYSEAWDAGRQCAEAEEERKDAWRELKTLARERLAARRAFADYPALCRAINSQARVFFRTIKEARGKIAELTLNNRHMAEAFEEGRKC